MNKPPNVGGRQRLIDATLTSLGKNGYHRSSLRTIAQIAGVTAGLVKHHFNGKDQMMLEAYRYFGDRQAEAYLAEMDRAGVDPVSRLEAFARTVFLLDAASEDRMRIWASFLEMAVTDSAVAGLQAPTRVRVIREITGCVAGIYAARGNRLSPDGAHRLALGIHSIVSGVWFQCSLNPSTMTPDEALDIVLDMIGGRIGVSFATGAGAEG